ncbi:MAG: 4'-phosphopantetheinyl transferase superfamily protein [Candidatus Omnitrophota bacterium]|jgi:holo-[acyl-carrier protein] synthase
MTIRHQVEFIRLESFKKLAGKCGEPFLRRLFTPSERRYCDSQRLRHENYGARYAAKKAVLKVLGLKADEKLFGQMEIRRRPNGQPYVRLSPGFCRKHGVRPSEDTFQISLAHEREYAVVAVVRNP